MMARTLGSAVLVLAGCANNGATTVEYDDVAQMLGAGLAVGEVATFTDAAMLARGVMPDGLGPGGGMMTGTRAGMSYRYMLSCVDANGAAVPCGAAAAAANVVAEWSGVHHSVGCDMTTERTASWNLAGLAQPIAAVSGTSSLVQDAMFSTATGMMMSSYHVTAHEDAQMQLDMSTPAIATGMLRLTLAVVDDERDAHGTDTEKFAMTAHVMIDGTSCTLVLDGTHGYAVDLATGDVSRAQVR